MAQTNFAALTPQQKLVWSRDTWKAARDMTFTKKFTGESQNSVIQRVTELTKTEKGEQCIMHLVADLVEDGVAGDSEREGNEEAIQSYSQVLEIDLLSHGVRNKGKMAEQKTVIDFRKNGKDQLANWLAQRIDQMVILTLSGISYQFQNDGRTRAKQTLAQLAFASYVTAPSAKRGLMWQNNQLLPSSTAALTATDTLSYKAIVRLRSYARQHYVKPLMANGKEYYVCMLRPDSYAQLKLDPDFQRAITTAMPRGESNPWFTGGVVTIDGIVFHEHNLVYGNEGAADGQRWGADGNLKGTRTLMLGAQALGMADLGTPDWVEKYFDYDSHMGINIDKMFGLLKPRFYSIYDRSVEDFGVVTLDHAQTLMQ